MPPSTVSLPSPGFQTNVSSPAPREATSFPRPPLTKSLPRAAGDGVVAIAAVDREIDLPGRGAPDALMMSFPTPPLTTSESPPASAPLIVTCAARPLTATDEPLVTTLIVSSPAVPLTVTVSATPSPWPLPGIADRSMATCLTAVPVRSLTLMLSTPPSVASWIFSTPSMSMTILPTLRNSRARWPLAEMSMTLVDIGAIEDQRIGAGLALNDIAAVAGIPDERVVTVTELRHVVAATAVDDVVAVAADQRVVALATGDAVGAGTAIDGQAHDVGRQGCGTDRVVAGTSVDRQHIAGFRIGDIDLRGKPDDRNRSAGTHDVDRVIAAGAGNRHGVRHAVGSAQVERDLSDAGTGQIADRDVVDAGERVELDVLDAVQIHGDVGNVAGELHMPMVGRDV